MCCKPNSRHKTDLIDHISEAYNILSTKYKRGLHFLIAGDTNDLNLTPILSLSPLADSEKKNTRIDPVTSVEALLDPIITSLGPYYQTAQCLPPLDSDPESNGKPSDHRIVVIRPISSINNKSSRYTRSIKVRPITQSGMNTMGNWIRNQHWGDIYEADSAHDKAQLLQTLLFDKFEELFPEKTRKVSSDDQPWISHKLKTLDRKRKREYHKHRKSEKWSNLNKEFKESVKVAKRDFYKQMISDVMSKNTSQWYSSVKRMTSYDQQKYEKDIIQEINHLSKEEPVKILADLFFKNTK